ncbi:MAG: SH3 domain-containing protein, partial [Clostridium sp.]
MLKNKDEDYMLSLNKARRRRNQIDYKKYILIAAGAIILIGGGVFFGKKMMNQETGGALVKESTQQGDPAGTVSEEESKAAAEAAEKAAVISSYKNLGIVQVSGYLNMRESASTDAKIIGKLQGNSACDVLDTSTEGWYQISSGGLTGYISSEFVLTGEEAKKKAEELVSLRAIISADALNIRKEPSTEAEVVGQALKNERYEVEE